MDIDKKKGSASDWCALIVSLTAGWLCLSWASVLLVLAAVPFAAKLSANSYRSSSELWPIARLATVLKIMCLSLVGSAAASSVLVSLGFPHRAIAEPVEYYCFTALPILFLAGIASGLEIMLDKRVSPSDRTTM